MSLYRYTMMIQFNNTAPPAGFSESWTNEENTDTLARNTMQTLIAERRKVLSSSWTISGGRISKLAVIATPPPAKIVQRLVQPLVCQSGLAGLLGDSDTPWTALFVEMTKFANPLFPSTRPRAQQMRGIPDTWWASAALAIPAADAAKLQGFFSFLINPTTFGAGQARINPDDELQLLRYRGICLKRISSRRIGRPFGLLRGRQSRTVAS